MTFSQRSLTHDAFLYGSPCGAHHSVCIEVVAVNKRTQQTSYMTLNLTVTPKQGDRMHQLVFTVLNMDIADLLNTSRLNTLQEKWGFYWSADSDLDLQIIELISLDTGRIGGVVPSGVSVKISGNLQFSVQLQDLKSDMGSLCSSSSSSSSSSRSSSRAGISTPPPPAMNTHFSPEYNIDWCSIRLKDLATTAAGKPELSPVDLQDSAWKPDVTTKSRHRDMNQMFILCVIFPLILGILMFIIFSIIMFGRREGVDKRNKQSTPTQMMHFNTIRQATSNLRLMSTVSDCDTIRPISRSGTPGSNTATRATTPKRSQTDLTTLSTSIPATGAKPILRRKSDTSHNSVDEETTAEKRRLVHPDKTPETRRIRT